uniref:Uncharacterized protein n=1 Tax=Amphimedon queenslandica TaxID=400682 RepID=A0A1X7TS52_AMPQE
LFCLVDLFSPTILEVAVTSFSPFICDFIPARVVHPSLLPDSLEGKRDTSGVFKRIGTGTADNNYMYVFDKPVPASDAKKSHGLGKLGTTTEHLPMVVKTFEKFIVPQKFFPDTVGQNIVIENIKQSTPEVRVKFPEKASVDDVVSALVSEIQSKPIYFELSVHPFEVVRNPYFVSWLNKHYGGKDLVIEGNESLADCNVSFHQTSKPDFFILHESQDFAAISVHSEVPSLEEGPVEGDDDLCLVSVAGECKQRNHNEPQTLANMVAVAGFVTYQAIKKKLKPRIVTIYGIGCIYEEDVAQILKLQLDFQRRRSHVTKFKN